VPFENPVPVSVTVSPLVIVSCQLVTKVTVAEAGGTSMNSSRRMIAAVEFRGFMVQSNPAFPLKFELATFIAYVKLSSIQQRPL